ncbi:D-alanyl-D-alanine carboxypeptidase [Flexibacter flexilis DSM 6793]|uniref:D-alanyl-D-alanine carboxypeptidase n=1 Tax=Flexibacter flexilis DSM 6793 TaxID=927664 RepID=A0A1I1G220_9BACT|nr:serine hydrolase domain-containing protein [Flexibacter flexilis]SFC03220.1 D-alanyl-D-alanine carboxypeptidase [Flexibacter flexilis DSM 6793]
MKNIFVVFLFVLLLMACEKSETIDPETYSCSFNFTDNSANHPKAQQYQATVNEIVSKGTVGIMMSVYHPNSGQWLGAAGKADINNNIAMQPCMTSRMGSTIKMFTATVTMLLYQEHKINLDEKISNYLKASYIHKIRNAETATIRQLLQHSSGIYNYIQNPKFQTASMNDLKREWRAGDLLPYAYHQPAYFAAGTDVRYSNTNYILLGLLIEQIEGQPLHEVFEKRIFNPLGMTKSLFAAKNPVPNNIARGYIDLYSNFKIIESTYFSGWDYYTADGGLISNPYDMSLFFRKLINGEIISQPLLNEMLTWKTPKEQDADFFPIAYGLGIFKMTTAKGDVYFHSGDAIGYYANMMYIPSSKSVIVYAVNSNYGKLDEWVSTKKAIEKILESTWE